MRWSDFLQTWDGHETENRFSRVVIIGLLVICVVTSLAAWRTERSIILVPPICRAMTLHKLICGASLLPIGTP